MNKNFVKWSILLGITCASLKTASYAMNHLLVQAKTREKTIADLMIQQQMRQTLKEAELKIAQAVEEEKLVIEQEKVVMKPPTPTLEEKKLTKIEEKAKKKKEEMLNREKQDQQSDESMVQETQADDKQLDEGIDAEAEAVLEMNIETYTNLTDEEQTVFITYLIEHYFLHGHVYVMQEEDPIRYEKKKLASDMEDVIIESIHYLLPLRAKLMTLKADDLKRIQDEVNRLSESFTKTYEKVYEKGKVFEAIYEASQAYFESYQEGINRAIQVLETLETASNKALVLPLMVRGINQEVVPAIKQILEQSFELKEKTNSIYTEGIDATSVLTRNQVIQYINDPYLILEKEVCEDAY